MTTRVWELELTIYLSLIKIEGVDDTKAATCVHRNTLSMKHTY